MRSTKVREITKKLIAECKKTSACLECPIKVDVTAGCLLTPWFPCTWDDYDKQQFGGLVDWILKEAEGV